MKAIDVPGRLCPSLVVSSCPKTAWLERLLLAAAPKARPPRMPARVSRRGRVDDDVHGPALEPGPFQGFYGCSRSLLFKFDEGKTTRPAAPAADDTEGCDPSEGRERSVQVAFGGFRGQVSDEESSQFAPPFRRTSSPGAIRVPAPFV